MNEDWVSGGGPNGGTDSVGLSAPKVRGDENNVRNQTIV